MEGPDDLDNRRRHGCAQRRPSHAHPRCFHTGRPPPSRAGPRLGRARRPWPSHASPSEWPACPGGTDQHYQAAASMPCERAACPCRSDKAQALSEPNRDHHLRPPGQKCLFKCQIHVERFRNRGNTHNRKKIRCLMFGGLFLQSQPYKW